MSELQIRIPQYQPELAAAVLQFIQAEFQQTTSFQPESSHPVQHKDLSLMESALLVMSIVANVDGTLNFAQRVQRSERVKKLHAAIQKAGQPVLMQIKNKTHDLYQKSVDEIMNLLAGDDD